MTRQREAFVVLLNNMDKYNELVEISADSAGNAAKKYQSYEEQFEASKNRIQAAWESLANNKELQSSLTTINNILAELIKALPYIIKYGVRFLAIMNAYKLPSALKGLGGFLIPGGIKNFAASAGQGWLQGWSSSSNFFGGVAKGAGGFLKNTLGYRFGSIPEDKLTKTPSVDLKTGTTTFAFRGLQEALNANTQATNANTNGMRGGGANPTPAADAPSTGDTVVADPTGIWKTVPAGDNSWLARGIASKRTKIQSNLTKAETRTDISEKKRTEEVAKYLKQQDKNAHKAINYNYNQYNGNNALGGAGMKRIRNGFRRIFKKKPKEELMSQNQKDQALLAKYGEKYGADFNPDDYISSKPVTAFSKDYVDSAGVLHKAGEVVTSDVARQEAGEAAFGDSTTTSTDARYAKDFTDASDVTHKAGEVIASDSEINKLSSAKSNQAANSSVKSAKGAGAVQAGIQGVAGAVTGYMTASTTSKVDTGRKDENGNTIYEEYEMDSSTAHASKGTTALVQGLGSMISPILGQLLGVAMDALWNRVLGPWIEHDKIAMKQRVESANNMLTAINGTTESTEKLNKLAKEGIQTIEDQSDWDKDIQDLLKSISGTDDDTTNARKLITKYLKENIDLEDYGISQDADLYTIVDQMQDNQEEQIALTQALLIAEKQAAHTELVASKEEEINKIYQQANDASNEYNDALETQANVAGWAAAGGAIGAGALAGLVIGSAFEGIGAIPGVIIGAIIGGVAGIGTGIAAHDAVMEDALDDSFSMSSRIEKLQDVLDKEYAKGDEADQELIEETQAILEETKACKAQLDAIYKEIDVNAMTVAAAEAYYDANGNGKKDDKESYLFNMSDEALKSLGLDKIKEIIIDQYIKDNGSTAYYDTTVGGEYSDWVNSVFASALKDDSLSNISDLFTGKAYTLSEALALPGQGEGGYTDQILTNFMNATGTTNISDLQKLAETFGDIKLSDWLLSGSEITEKLQTINDIVSDLASDSKTISEKENTIISQYPQLIKYLGNTKSLMSELVSLSSKYAQIDISSKFNDITGSKNAYSELLKGLKSDKTIGADITALLNDSSSGFGDIQDIGSLIQWLAKNGYSDGVGKAIYEYVLSYFGEASLTSDTQKTNINTVIEYQKSLLDDELDNLNEQKEAMESINEQREYENKLIEARLKLEAAQNEKKRVWRAGVGWTYESDQSAILEAQENLESVENEKTTSALDDQIAELEQQKADLEAIQNAESLQYQKDLYDAYTAAWGSTTAEQFKTDVVGALDGVSQKISELIATETGNITTQRESAISNLETIWNGDGSSGVSGMSLGDLQAKVANGTASDEEKAEYDTRARSFQTTYNDAVNNNLLSSDDFSNGTFNFDGSADNAQSIATNSKTDLGSSYINNDEDKEYYYVVDTTHGGWEHGIYGSGTLFNEYYAFKLPETYTNMTDDEAHGIFHDGDVARVYDGTKSGLSLGYIKDDAKRWEYDKTGSTIPDGLYFTYHGSDHYFAIKDGKFYEISDSNRKTITKKVYDSIGSGMYDSRSIDASAIGFADGTLDLVNVNELGTEAIVTPDGTVTALPSHSGIVPADITKNLWELGEVAPSISRTLMANMIPDSLQQNSMSSTTDESLNVNTINITMNPDGSFDVDAFVNALRSRVALTRNSSK